MVSPDQPCRPLMPFRLNPNRPKRFRARYRIRNWPQYEAGLKRRGDLTFWLDETAIAGWQAPRRTTPGGQALYSDRAIELVLALRLVFRLGLRQAEGIVTSVLRLFELDRRCCMEVEYGRLTPCYGDDQRMRTETGLATRIMRLSTSLPSATSPCWFAIVRERNRGPIRAL